MRIISGKYKNKDIPFINAKFDDAEATPQKMKKALFSIIGEDLTGTQFLDLYSCSGQIGFEALSRGASVVMNEIDHKRYSFIKAVAREWKVQNDVVILNYHAYRCARFLASIDKRFENIFIDMPYPKNDTANQYCDVLIEIAKHAILRQNGTIVIQHSHKVKLDGISDTFNLKDTKTYGKNCLSIFI